MNTTNSQFSDGAAYERLMGRWSRRAGVPFLNWCAVPAAKDWLDVGCGNGAFTEEIITRAAPSSVTGIDPSAAQIEFAKSRGNTKLAKFTTGDAQSLPFEASRFDVAAMALVIAFIPDPAKAVAELKRVLRPGGLAATYMWDLPGGGVPLSPLYRALKAMDVVAPMPPHPEMSSQDSLRNLWTDAGFRNIEIAAIRIKVDFENFDDFWESNTLPVGPQAQFINALTPDRREQLRQHVKKSIPTDSAGRISYEAVANAVKGSKVG